MASTSVPSLYRGGGCVLLASTFGSVSVTASPSVKVGNVCSGSLSPSFSWSGTP